MPGGIGTVSFPLGPSTRTWSPIWTFTPDGNGIGFLPILDIVRFLKFSPRDAFLPDLAKQLTTHALFAGTAAGHYATRCSQDVYSESAENARNLFTADIYPATGSRYALNGGNGGLVGRRVFQIDSDALGNALFYELVVHDVALFFEDSGDFHFQLGRRDVDLLVPGLECITHPGQHIG